MEGFTRRRFMSMAAAAIAAPSVASAQSPGEVRTIIQFGVSYLPLMVIEEERLLGTVLERMGEPRSELKLQRVSGSTAVNDALLAGIADMGVMGVPSLLIIAEKTRGGVKGLSGCSAFPMVLNTVSERIRTLADFTSEDRIATPAATSPQNLCLKMAAGKAFGDYRRLDTKVVSLPHPDAMAAMLAGTEVKAHFTNAPFAQFEADNPRVRRLLTSDEVFGKAASFVMLAANTKFVEGRPKVAAALVRAMEAAMAIIADDPARAAALYLRQEPSKLMTPAYVEKIIPDPENSFNVAPAGVMAYANAMLRTDQLKASPAKWQEVFFPFIHDRQGS